MKVRQIRRDERGTTAIEFAITAPVFFLILIGVIECGLVLWAQIGLQHGAEMAARCMTVDPSLCGTTAQTQTYAAQQAYGLNPPVTSFSVSAATCGNQVSASYQFSALSASFGLPSLQIDAQSCFPR